jgi:hypothetical protein
LLSSFSIITLQVISEKKLDGNGIYEDYSEILNGLCGAISVAAIVGMSANDLVTWAYAGGINPDYMDFNGIKNMVNTIPGWNAYYCNASGGGYCGVNRNNSTQVYKSQALDFVKRILRSGGYNIVRVWVNSDTGSLDLNGVPHWVVISGISDDGYWVSIYNPYDNGLEWYLWDIFLNNWYKEEIIGVQAGIMVVAYPDPENAY